MSEEKTRRFTEEDITHLMNVSAYFQKNNITVDDVINILFALLWNAARQGEYTPLQFTQMLQEVVNSYRKKYEDESPN